MPGPGHLPQGLLDELSSRLCAAPRTSPLALALYGLAWLFPLVGFLLAYFPHFTLFHLFGYAYGSSTFLLARVAGVADKSLIPVALLVLKAGQGGERAWAQMMPPCPFSACSTSPLQRILLCNQAPL
jgi:hypothetical protein